MIDSKLITPEMPFTEKIKDFKQASTNTEAENSNKEEITKTPPSV